MSRTSKGILCLTPAAVLLRHFVKADERLGKPIPVEACVVVCSPPKKEKGHLTLALFLCFSV